MQSCQRDVFSVNDYFILSRDKRDAVPVPGGKHARPAFSPLHGLIQPDFQAVPHAAGKVPVGFDGPIQTGRRHDQVIMLPGDPGMSIQRLVQRSAGRLAVVEGDSRFLVNKKWN